MGWKKGRMSALLNVLKIRDRKKGYKKRRQKEGPDPFRAPALIPRGTQREERTNCGKTLGSKDRRGRRKKGDYVGR